MIVLRIVLLLFGVISLFGTAKQIDELEQKLDEITQRLSHKGSKLRIPTIEDIDSEIDNLWNLYKLRYREKSSRRNKAEESEQKRSFAERAAKVIRHNVLFNEGKSKFKMGFNAYSNADERTYLQKVNGLKMSQQSPTKLNADMGVKKDQVVQMNIPDEVDLRYLMSPIRDQGYCGSCYAFATVAAVEAMYKKSMNGTMQFSEQQLIDCSKGAINEGCNGGMLEPSFEYMQNGIMSEQKYPYVEKDHDECRYNASEAVAMVVRSIELTPFNERSIMETLQFGPVAIGIDASASEFANYDSGIYDGPCDKNNLNHAVLLVGYGTETHCNESTDYWLVRNSYGESWGEQGYFRLLRNEDNFCGVASIPAFATVFAAEA